MKTPIHTATTGFLARLAMEPPFQILARALLRHLKVSVRTRALRARLTERATLIIGKIKDSVSTFFSVHRPPPIGFISFDLDLHSSTRDALRVFAHPESTMLWHIPLYFDDIEFLFNHRFAGELLAIDEFNEQSKNAKIDRWYNVRAGRPFPERPYLERLYVAHDLRAASAVVLDRVSATLPLRATS